MNFLYDGAYSMPGQGTVRETYENQFWFGERHQQMWTGMLLSGASRDTGNTSYTTVLRTGLLMGMVTATKKIKEWNPTGTDGSQYILGVLDIGISPQRLGSDADKWLAYLMVGGTIKADRLLIPGNTTLGISGETYEYEIRAQLHRRFLFSDAWSGNPMGGFTSIRNLTATDITNDAHTVTYAENNTLFTTYGGDGAFTFTLPASPKHGLHYGFYNAVDQSMTVASASSSDNIVAFNDAAADSIAFSTTGEKLGGYFEVFGNGSKWLAIPGMWGQGLTAQTLTVG